MSENTTLYRLFDQTDELLYIGVAGNPGRRFSQHSGHKLWWGNVSYVRLEHFSSRDLALEAEKAAIQAENPRFNFTHKPNSWREEQASRMRAIGKESHCIGPVEWRGSVIQSPQSWPRRRFMKAPSVSCQKRGTKNSPWTCMTLVYDSFFQWDGLEIGPTMVEWSNLWAYCTSQTWYSPTEVHKGTDWAEFWFPSQFHDVFYKVILCAEQGVEHQLLSAIDEAIDPFRQSEMRFWNIKRSGRTWTDARDDALVSYLNAHHYLVEAIARFNAA